MKQVTAEEIVETLYSVNDGDNEFTAQMIARMNRWLTRGDGVAVYENQDFGHARLGERKFVSFGSEEALIPGEEPPDRLPDIGNTINWRYWLVGVYRGDPIPVRETM